MQEPPGRPPVARDWRWRCPHCGVGSMKLASAERHLRRRHFDCASCRIERLMVQAMMEGKGFIIERENPLRHLFSRARG